jgi:hypothetical protein
MLGVFGPLGLLAILGILSIGVIGCYTGLFWSAGARFSATTAAPIGQDLYFSAAAFVSASTPSEPSHSLGRARQVVEAANGFAFLAIAIGYLPALFQAFSRREDRRLQARSARRLAADSGGSTRAFLTARWLARAR